MKYTKAEHADTEVWRRVHQNDEETHVVVYSATDTYVAVAVDVSPEFEELGTETITVSTTAEDAINKAEKWMQQNPKGVLGDESGGGMLRKLGIKD